LVAKKWNGPPQFEDEESGKLMMLPSDIALINDPKFKKYVEAYAKDQNLFFNDFANAFGKLISLGCPENAQPFRTAPSENTKDKHSADFRELAMHGSVLPAKNLVKVADVHQVESSSGRNALHKAAFWGHVDMVKFLIEECELDPNAQDNYGDTPLHDAAKFGHTDVAKIALKNPKTNRNIKNKEGKTPLDIAKLHGKKDLVTMLSGQSKL